MEINTIGDSESRNQYREKLVQYFSQYKTDLSEDSQTRLQSNPLRILDSKDEKDQELVQGAPGFSDSLNENSKSFYAEVLVGLEKLGISYHQNSRLVRGLDYYNHTVFEFTTSHLGSQNAVLSGGRYNNLIEQMGGPSTPGVGWAAGTDRLALLLEKPSEGHQTVAIISASDAAKGFSLELLDQMRSEKIPSQIIYSGNMSKQMKKANKRNCSHAVILGDEELKSKKFLLKDLQEGGQESLDQDSLIAQLKTFYKIP